MPNYNFLPDNRSDFPHVGNVDVYKYDNNFDYKRFDAVQMELQLCTVPWDMGEAHIGNRTISGIGNVVYFESKAKRDKWFDDIPDSECFRFTTKYKELHRDFLIDVPVPYDVCAKHNYLVVRYAKFANEDSPVQYEENDGLREWFWFVREVEFVAPNTTRLHLLDDAFQTWIYDVNINSMILERGHAPMFATSVSKYLSNPVENNKYLLTEDINFGNADIVKSIDALELNSGTMYACIATTANPKGNWGSKSDGSWNVPASSYYVNSGVPSVYVMAVAVSNLNTFLSNVTTSYPQFKQTVQGIFFASADLLTLGTSFTFASVTCYPVSASRKSLDFVTLGKNDFGYDTAYANIAKLYTYPYAHIEITDENGNIDVIKIEDTSGKIKANVALSLAYPFVNIDAYLEGVGGNAYANVTYKNIDSKTFKATGRWYDTLKTWNVPTFAVVLDAASEYDYATHFDRAQRVVDYTTDYNNTTDASATAQTNVNADAGNITANALLATTAATATVTRANQSAQDDSNNTVNINNANNTGQNYIIDQQTAATTNAQDQQGAISAASTTASGTISAGGSLLSLDLGGAATAGAQAAIGAATTLAQTQVAIGLTTSMASYTKQSNNYSTDMANNSTTYRVGNQKATQSDLTDISNDLTSGTAANNSATMIANAARTKSTSDTLAGRTRSQAQSAIANDVSQAALRDPFIYGSFSYGETATNRPIALFSHVVTQSKNAIASAGDEMLRYGYRLDQQWKFDGNWNIGPYFTYWKLKDFWVTNLNVPDMYMDKLRFFLFGGVTVWRKPEYIGHVSIYDNFNG